MEDIQFSWAYIEKFLSLLLQEAYNEPMLSHCLRSARSNWTSNIETLWKQPQIELQVREALKHLATKQREIEESNLPNKTERIEFLQALVETIQPVATQYSLSGKLKWQGNKNTLYDIFRQIKNTNNAKNQPLIDNTYDQIAAFIIQSFEGFSEKDFTTVRAELTKEKDKLRNKVEIDFSSEPKPEGKIR